VNHKLERNPIDPQKRPKAMEIIDMYVKYTVTGKNPTRSRRLDKNQRLYRKR
jgi:hypothetical protein